MSENRDFWETLQKNIVKAREYEEQLKRNIDHRTMLDAYCSAIAPRLKPEKMKKTMLEAAERGRTYCTLFYFDEPLPLTARQRDMLLNMVQKTIRQMFENSSFIVYSESPYKKIKIGFVDTTYPSLPDQ